MAHQRHQQIILAQTCHKQRARAGQRLASPGTQTRHNAQPDHSRHRTAQYCQKSHRNTNQAPGRQFYGMQQRQSRHQAQPIEREPAKIGWALCSPRAGWQGKSQTYQCRHHARCGVQERQGRPVKGHRNHRYTDDEWQRTKPPHALPRWWTISPAGLEPQSDRVTS